MASRPGGPPPRPDLVPIGEILGAHGLRGEVRLRSFAQDPAAIASYSPLASADGAREFAIAALRPGGANPDIFVATLAGVGAREAAEALAGLRLHVPRQRLPAAGEDEFHHADLLGCRVELASGVSIGTVAAVQNFGAGDLIEVALHGRLATEFLPFTHEFVPIVDVAARRIVVAAGALPEQCPAGG